MQWMHDRKERKLLFSAKGNLPSLFLEGWMKRGQTLSSEFAEVGKGGNTLLCVSRETGDNSLRAMGNAAR